MADVVSAINENNRKLPTLWMRHNLRAVIVDKEARITWIDARYRELLKLL